MARLTSIKSGIYFNNKKKRTQLGTLCAENDNTLRQSLSSLSSCLSSFCLPVCIENSYCSFLLLLDICMFMRNIHVYAKVYIFFHHSITIFGPRLRQPIQFQPLILKDANRKKARTKRQTAHTESCHNPQGVPNLWQTFSWIFLRQV